MANDRKAALDAAMKKIEKNYGKGKNSDRQKTTGKDKKKKKGKKPFYKSVAKKKKTGRKKG